MYERHEKCVCVGGGHCSFGFILWAPKNPYFILYAFLNSPRLDKSIAGFSFTFDEYEELSEDFRQKNGGREGRLPRPSRSCTDVE